MVDWKRTLRVSYFLLLAIIVAAILLPGIFTQTFYNIPLASIYLAVLVVIIGVIAYATSQIPNLGTKLHDIEGQVLTLVSIILTIVLAWFSYTGKDSFMTAIFVGALGGVIHELAQSNGKFMLPREAGGEIYLGGLFGLIAGGVAGLILGQGLPQGTVTTQTLSEAFLAGLGLKGFSEAVAGKRPEVSPP